MNQHIKNLLTELASACAKTQPELSAQALTLVNESDKIITEITDETTVGQIKQWMASIRQTSPDLMPKFDIESFSKRIESVVKIWDNKSGTWVCLHATSLEKANQAIRDYNPEQVRQRKIAELKAQIDELEGEK